MYRIWYLTIAGFFLFCSYANFAWALPGELEVKFLDIGQGDSILIQTPHQRTVLIDGGPGVTILERLGEELSFWQKDIDIIILTHPDLDHLEGLVEVLKRYSVEQVMMTGVVHHSALYKTFISLLGEKQIHPTLVSADQDWMIDDGVYLDVLYPVESVALQEVDNANDTSVVVKLIYGETVMFLGGDIEEDTENELLLTDFDLSAQIHKSGHHGSKSSDGPTFLKAVDPDQAVIMSGKDNPFGHPHLETVLTYDEQGIEWQNTKDLGTITLRSDGRSWKTISR